MQITIEKMIYGGDGLGRLPDDSGSGKAVFIPFVLPGERIEAELTEQKSGFARARLEEILQPSASRVPPPCPYFARCGGCHYQHTGYENQLALKESILRETLRRTAKLEWSAPIQVHGSQPWNYRNRTRMRFRATPFAVGYYKFNSHELLSVEECPISSPLINRALATIWKIGNTGAAPSEIEEIEFFADAEDAALLIEFYATAVSDISLAALRDFAEELKQQLPELVGAAALERSAAEPKQHPLFGAQELLYKTNRASYRVSAGSFFQVNRFMIDELLQIALADRSGASALDLYAGTGLFSIALAKNFEKVVAIEGANSSFRDLQHNAPKNVHAVHQSTQQFLTANKRRFDLVLADPPRAGMGAAAVHMLAKAAGREVVYVSCDPATLARDARVLIEEGLTLRELHLLDLFPQTYHMETIARFSR